MLIDPLPEKNHTVREDNVGKCGRSRQFTI